MTESAADHAPPRPDDDGRRWMLAFQRGDDAAFDAIVVAHREAVHAFLRRYVSDRDRIEDLVQEVFLRVFRSRGRYRPTAGFRTWLFTIATRLALNEIRGTRRRRRVFAEGPRSPPANARALADRAIDEGAESAQERLLREELLSIVDRLIEDLPPNQRAAIVLSRQERFSYREIAEIVGVSTPAVKSLLMRAREALREQLAPYLESGELPLTCAKE